jgi:E3 SUMO-protein ligase RanBP2
LVKLAEVEVVTGEENEEAVFKQRCKLYRFDQDLKEWKEKGTGEMKVLKHKTNENVYRILMRRDQVLKLCANHRVTVDLKLEVFNEKQVRWHAQDYSESEGKHELLAARFRNEEEAKKFKAEVEKAQEAIQKGGTATNSGEKKSEVEKKPADKCEGLKQSLSEMFKKGNQWTCDGCYVSNKDEVKNCVACNAPRKGG